MIFLILTIVRLSYLLLYNEYKYLVKFKGSNKYYNKFTFDKSFKSSIFKIQEDFFKSSLIRDEFCEYDLNSVDFYINEFSDNKISSFWIVCQFCESLNYKKLSKDRFYICNECESYIEINSFDRIDLLVDKNSWVSFNDDMSILEPLDFDLKPEKGFNIPADNKNKKYIEDIYNSSLEFELSKEVDFFNLVDEGIVEDYKTFAESIYRYQKKTNLVDSIQTGICKINNKIVALGIMDSFFIRGSMGSVAGEKISVLIEYAYNNNLPLLLVSASSGARVQEGIVGLYQMAKISSLLYNYQLMNRLFFISFISTPTMGGVLASFAMLGDIIISEPDVLVGFAGKELIEEIIKVEVPEGIQESEKFYDCGLIDLVLPRFFVRPVLNYILKLHGF
uniref:Acetyl-CoA carboxylase subunit n=1 Tax=Pilostyles hamiltonii TaxID=448041 RepID=A0A0U3AJZ5_9ROSI|nr:acetyl-CoA carboxylase subunit [Pilostyles hamiltonii]ALT22441.1 acetyl-CoA carboxylase subunit [Pilostyles hamiltonii]